MEYKMQETRGSVVGVNKF